MKYHTTISNIVFALLILFVIIGLLSTTTIQNRLQFVVESFVTKTLDKELGDKNYILKITSIDKTLFSNLKLKGVSLQTSEGYFIATADDIEIKVPVYRLVNALFFPKSAKITINALIINYNDESELLTSLLKNLSGDTNSKLKKIELSIKNSNIYYNSKNIYLDVDKLNLDLTLNKDYLDSLYLQSDRLIFSDKSHLLFDVSLFNVNLHKKNTLEQQLKGEYAKLLFSDKQENLKLESVGGLIQIETKDIVRIGEESAKVVLNSTYFSGNYNDIKIELKELELKGKTESLSYFDSNVTFKSLLADYENYKLKSSEIYLEAEGETGDLKGILSFNDSIELYKDNDLVASLNKSQIEFSLKEDIHKIDLISDSLSVPNIKGIFEVDPLESGQLKNLHLGLEFDQKIQLTTDFYFEGITKIPLIENITGQFDLGMVLEKDFKPVSGYSNIKNLTATNGLGPISAKFNFLEQQISVDAQFKDSLKLNGIYHLENHEIEFEFKFNNFGLMPLKESLESLNFQFIDLIGTESALNGNIVYKGDLRFLNGSGDINLEILNFKVENRLFNIKTALKGSFDSEAYFIDHLSFEGEGLEAFYSGSIDRVELIPEGNIVIKELTNNQVLLEGSFKRDLEQLYLYSLSSNLLGKTVLDGHLRWSEERILYSEGFLKLPTISYPVSLFVDTYNLLAKLNLENLEVVIDFLSEPTHASMVMMIDGFQLPPLNITPFKDKAVVKGVVEANFSLTDNLFLVESSSLKVDNLYWDNSNRWSINTDFVADPYQLRINNLTYTDKFGSLKGSLSLLNRELKSLFERKLNNFFFNVDILGDDDSFIKGYFYSEQDNETLAKGLLVVDKLDSSRFLKNSTEKLNIKLVGQTDLAEEANLNLEIKSENIILKGAVEDNTIIIDEGALKSGVFGVFIDKGSLDLEGSLDIKGSLTIDSPITWRDASSNLPFTIETQLKKSKNLNQLIDNIIDLKYSIPKTTITNGETTLYGLIKWPEGSHSLEYNDRLLEVKPLSNGAIDLNYNLNSGFINVTANENFPFPLKANGLINSKEIALNISEIKLQMKHLNAFFMEPIIDFKSGVMVGNGWIEGPFKDPEYWATFSGSSVEMTTFWTVGELISIKNPTVMVAENTATINPSYVTVVHESGRSTKALAKMEATLEKWNIPNYRLDIIEIENPISFWLPLFLLDLNIEAKVQGPFAIEGTPDEETLYGDITVSDAKISFGIPNIPSWVVEKRRTSIDMTLQTGRNVSFVYPNDDSPILSATLADNQTVQLKVFAPSMLTTMSGELAFRSGEIYYVQKNFYITEGSLKFPSIGTTFDSELLALLNLRARLREFDAEGNRIDIYLVLQDSRFDSINPRFESIPSLSTNEILELLGQSIVAPGGFRDSALHSVVSVASAATDVISRLGLFQATTISIGFTNIIRESLGLDVFTIRTNLLQNILFEALPGLGYDSYVSPLARYLDNTTIYIGKYLSDDFYLQGMVHFRQDSGFKGSSFLANDLRVDTELSVEWTNPLATFSFFTQPEELSVFEFFDTIGFSITKRIEF